MLSEIIAEYLEPIQNQKQKIKYQNKLKINTFFKTIWPSLNMETARGNTYLLQFLAHKYFVSFKIESHKRTCYKLFVASVLSTHRHRLPSGTIHIDFASEHHYRDIRLSEDLLWKSHGCPWCILYYLCVLSGEYYQPLTFRPEIWKEGARKRDRHMRMVG